MGTAAATITGAGNWLIGFDRIGPLVMEQVRGRYGAEDVEVCTLGGAAMALLDHLRGQELVLMVDACVGQGKPGEVYCYEPDLTSSPAGVGSLHQIGPLETLLVAQHFCPETLPKRILFVAVETEGLDAGAEPAVCRQVVAILDREIAAWSKNRRSIVEYA